jgi:hypothetical protein
MKRDLNGPRELPSAFITKLSSDLVTVSVSLRTIIDTFDDVSVPFLSFVVPLYHKIRKVRHH